VTGEPARGRRRRTAAVSWAAVLVTAVLTLASCTGGPASEPAAPPLARTQPTDPPLPVEHWRALFDEAVPSALERNEPLSRSTDSWDYYELAYLIDSFGSMYAATGDLAYVRQGFQLVGNMLATARPSSSMPTSNWKDRFSGWVSEYNDGEETPLYESYAWRYVTRLLRLVQPVLAQAPEDIQQQYARILAFTETNIVDKWLDRGADNYIYRNRAHTAAHWAMIALNVSELTDDPERRALCLAIVQRIDDDLPNHPSSLHGQMRPHPKDPSAYWWSDIWGQTDGPGQDVSHGNGVVTYVVEAHDLGGSWSDLDLDRLSQTLTEFVMGTPERYPRYVDGSGRDNGWLSDGWVKLGRYDPAVQALLESHPVQNWQYHAAMAENARYLETHGN
jgi:hypothetical protein